MKTIFRFAIQTPSQRHSEIWSFFGSKREACLYATRTSMKDWLKVSFHQSGACHLKTYPAKSRSNGTKDFVWTYPDITDSGPVHVMRVVYDISKQTATFPFSDRVKVIFDELSGNGSVYLDTFFTLSDGEIVESEESGIVAAHRLEGRRWVYFTLGLGPPQPDLPQSISGMTFHIGEVEKDAANSLGTTLLNATGLWYSVPESSGTFLVLEASFARLALNLDPCENQIA